MTDAQIRAAAIAKLRAEGATLPDDAWMRDIAPVIERYTTMRRYHGVQPGDFVRAYVCPPTPAAQINRMAREEYVPDRHPRAAEIDVLPRQIGTGGVGNGAENSPVWTR